MKASILDALDAHAHERPDRAALDDVSYDALRTASLRVASRLREAGIMPGDRIALYAENSRAFVYAYLGGLRAGAIVVPVNVLYRSSDFEHVAQDCGARAICVSAQSAEHVARSPDRVILDLSEIEAWADDARVRVQTFETPSPDDIAILIYTSGTTGRSKGAMLTHRNLAAIAESVVEAWRWTADDTLLLALPLFHVHGLGAGLNGSLVAGGGVRLYERFDAGTVLPALAAGEATMFFGVPTVYVRLLEHARDGTRFDRVRLFVSGSAALPASVHEAFEARFGVSILERYGATEFGFALGNRYEGPRYAGTVGFPLPGASVRLADADGRDVAGGEAGEVLVSGPTVCRGYWRNEEATAAAFLYDESGTRWYRSGDLATFDPVRGYTIAGRLKELIISAGFNIYPSEVENELLHVSGVRAAAVVGEPHDARGEVPVAFVEVDADFNEAAATEYLRGRLASFKVPKAFYRIDSLPRNAMGKVEKPKLVERLKGAG